MTPTRQRGWIARFLFPATIATNASGHAGANDASESANDRGALFASAFGPGMDLVRAVECFRQAAEDGYAPAQTNLGTMLASGRGVDRNQAEAGKWFRRAAEQGNAEGILATAWRTP